MNELLTRLATMPLPVELTAPADIEQALKLRDFGLIQLAYAGQSKGRHDYGQHLSAIVQGITAAGWQRLQSPPP